MIDVLVVLPDLRFRGAERSTVLLVRGLAERGLSVHVAVARAGGPLRTEIPDEVTVHELSPRGMGASLPSLSRLIRRVRPVAVLSALTHANIVTVAATIAGGGPAPVLVEHTVFSQVGSRGYRTVLAAAAAAAYRRASCVVAVSAPVADDVCRAFRLSRDSVRVLPNPIDFDRIDVLATEPAKTPGTPLVVAVGRLAPEKDYLLLFEAFALLSHPRAHLLVLGEGPERRILEGLADSLGLADRVSLPGHDSNPYRWMARAAALVISSHYEGLPTVALEAAYLGVPVVAVDDGYGLEQALRGEQSVHIVRERDPASLADALGSALGGDAPPLLGGASRTATPAGAARGDQALRYGIEPVSARFAELLNVVSSVAGSGRYRGGRGEAG
ncbi:MAG: glycosyltransferase [Thermoleophilia bacterium]